MKKILLKILGAVIAVVVIFYLILLATAWL
jgi:hypothetical protein